MAAGLRFPQMEAWRDRTLEAEGLKAGEISSPSLGAALDPWDSAKEGTPTCRRAGGVGLLAACLAEGFLAVFVGQLLEKPGQAQWGGRADV